MNTIQAKLSEIQARIEQRTAEAEQAKQEAEQAEREMRISDFRKALEWLGILPDEPLTSVRLEIEPEIYLELGHRATDFSKPVPKVELYVIWETPDYEFETSGAYDSDIVYISPVNISVPESALESIVRKVMGFRTRRDIYAAQRAKEAARGELPQQFETRLVLGQTDAIQFEVNELVNQGFVMVGFHETTSYGETQFDNETYFSVWMIRDRARFGLPYRPSEVEGKTLYWNYPVYGNN